MKRFMAIFTGSEAAMAEWKQLPEEKRKAREEQGMKAWMAWGTDVRARSSITAIRWGRRSA